MPTQWNVTKPDVEVMMPTLRDLSVGDVFDLDGLLYMKVPSPGPGIAQLETSISAVCLEGTARGTILHPFVNRTPHYVVRKIDVSVE